MLYNFKKSMKFESAEIFPEKGLGGSSHGSTITEDSNGILYSAWYSGAKEKAADVKIFMSKKNPGKNWKTPWLIEKEGITSRNPFITGEETPQELAELEHEETSEGNPVLYYVKETQKLLLFWVTMRGAGDKSGWSACIIKTKDSNDGGKTWSSVRIVRDNIGWMTRNKPILLSNQDLLLPIMAELGLHSSMFYRISKKELMKGATQMQIQEPGQFIEGGVIQPTIVEVKPGHLRCWMRTNQSTINCPNLIALSTSSDYGKTWTPIQPMKDRIPNPDSGCDAVRLTNGHIILVCNPLATGRQQLTVFLSENDGETFPYRRDLEPIESDKEYHYPAVIQDHNGLIQVTYTNRRLNIKWACFDEDWIKNNKKT
jgi:alpha-L-fucosidase